MAVKTDRIETRVSPEQREHIERAAAFFGESLSSFMVAAAVQRADEVIAEHSATVVPSAYFDQLLAALDDDAELSPGFTATAEQARRRRRIRTA